MKDTTPPMATSMDQSQGESLAGKARLIPATIHSTAHVEKGVQLGHGTKVWDNVHIRYDTVIGEQCIIGGKSYIAYEVKIGDRVKINSSVYVCTGVTIETGVFIGAGTIFTNDRFPRATTPDLKELYTSDPDENTLPTLVKEGASIGAGAIIGCDLSIGRFAMVGMGALITKSVPNFHLVFGSPATSRGAVCRCGRTLLYWEEQENHGNDVCLDVQCQGCNLHYHIDDRNVHEVGPPQ